MKTESLGASGMQDDYSADFEVEKDKEFIQICEEHVAQLRASRQADELAHWTHDDFETIVHDWPQHLRHFFIELVCIACVDFEFSTRDALVSTWESMIGKPSNGLKKWRPEQVTTRIEDSLKNPGFLATTHAVAVHAVL